MRRGHANTAGEFAGWIAGLRPRSIPRAVTELAKEHLLDGFATMLAGSREEASRRVDRYLLGFRGKGRATVLATNLRLRAEHAALANGVRGHVLDFDDAQLSTRRNRPFGQLTHPTSPVLAAALASAEELGLGGRELLAAYVAGVEIACRLADAVDPRHYLEGFHPTGTIAVFGSAAASAHLMRLNRGEIAHALGIAGSLAAGVRAQRGTMTKALNAGRAAENGVFAARLARTGFSASTNIFDDPMGYFMAACRGNIERRLLHPGRPFFLSNPGLSIKLYPCAGVMHPALDALIELVQAHDIQPADVAEVRVKLGPDAALPLVYDRPRNGLEAKFSVPFSAAAAIVFRAAGLRQYTDEQARNPLLSSVMKRVRLERVPGLRSIGTLGAQAEVDLVVRDGRRYKSKATHARGHPKRRLSRSELTDKFHQCAAGQVPAPSARRFVAEVWRIENVSSISRLIKLLRPPA